MSSINLQESQLSGCETYIAIVVDESGSISTTEAGQIKAGLTSFITSQAQSKITLSLIGMSDSDDTLRSENIIQKKISANQTEFLTWINSFGSGRATKQSDYWASGLKAVNELSVTPDIIVIVADGMQANNYNSLKNLYKNLNLKSQIFVYGVTSNAENVNELITPLTSFLEKTPILKSGSASMLDADYIRVPDFSTLGDELNQLNTDLSNLQVGCVANVSIIENKLVYPLLKRGLPVHQTAGTLVLKNKSRVALTLPAGTKIHNASSIDGLVFKLDSAVTIPGSSTLEVTIRIDGTPLLTGNFSAPVVVNKVKNPSEITINFNVTKEVYIVPITADKTTLQSTYLQIAAAGSKGVDSTKGIHLRWMLAGKLGEKHLPKGDLFTGERSNFNKPDDFVKVYRAPYSKFLYTLNLNIPPSVSDTNKALWIYKTPNSDRPIYVYFKNKAKYLSVKLSINPQTNPAAFIQEYGNNIIEIETKTELFFAAELAFATLNSSGVVKLETLAVAENTATAAKRVTNRKIYSSDQVSTIRLVTENGKRIRFKASNCLLSTINFEFYSDFINEANANGLWDFKGKYALSNNDTKVFAQLEPKLNAVHGKWLKYNNDEYVNIANYKDRWNKTTTGDDRNIKSVVNKYVALSEVSDNPTAIETVPFGDAIPINEPLEGQVQQYAENLTEISNLDMLNIAANDYHIARMLGLGCIDLDDEIFSGEFIYLTEYTTFGSLEGGITENEVLHLSMSIPTSVNTERLPLPVQLSKIVPGLNIGSDENQTAKITDANGYSFDGKKRYVSLFMDDVMDYDINTEFFNSPTEYDGSSFTFPIYLGVTHKINSELNWRKPELAYDSEYKNIQKDLTEGSFEPAPIIIPESGKSILNVRQEESGSNQYYYQGYGINIFSRATTGRQLNIESNIEPANTLMPPTGINTLLITDENPLMFTSQSEQVRLNAIPLNADKTLIRVLFEYYTIQELLSYDIPTDMTIQEAKDANAIFPDNKEIFADSFKLYYKDSLPQIEYASIDSIENSTTDNLTSIVKIKEYKILSSGEQIKVTLNNPAKFIGGILTIGDQNYVVKDVEVVYKSKVNISDPDVFDYALVEVLKKEVSESILADGDATVDSEQIKEIQKPENGLCTLVENMLTPSNWHQPGPLDFQVQFPTALKTVHREVIQPDSEDPKNLQVEKSRGIWENVIIERVLEDSFQMDTDGKYILDSEKNPIPLTEKKHLGLYKIIFPNFNLSQHPQFKSGNENSVEWFTGIVRLFTKSAVKAGSTIPVKSRKEFKVVRTENIGETGDLIAYINDTNFKVGDYSTQTMHPDYDEIIGAKNPGDYEVGYISQKINYYPNYKVYLYADPVHGITATNIQPREGESTHYSIFGISTHSNTLDKDSKISVPSPMYAVKIVAPEKPEEVKGSLYATRPDFFNRSTFTLTTKYTHKPYGILHYRANDEAILSVLYERETINTIREELKKLGGNDEAFFSNRWKNFLDFDSLANQENYNTFPPEADVDKKYHFPIPDNTQLIKSINEFTDWHNSQSEAEDALKITSLTALNQVLIYKEQGIENDLLAIHFIEQAIHTAFVPLTEVPVIYEFINGNDYVPINKKQTIKNKNGAILKPSDPEFDIAPMMKITDEVENRTQFTDFNLDGNSQNIYFYGVREMDIKMNFSEFSTFWGPVKLVASNPPQTPEIKRIMPILENPVLGIKPTIQFEINAYYPEYKIKKINIYRATSMLDAQSIRTMTPVKEVLISEDTLSNDFDNVWTVYDEFEDLEFVPFGDGLFYRITVSREIEYADAASTKLNPIVNIDYTPSQPSKITATVISDNVSPESPQLEASGTPTGSVLKPVIFNWQKTVHNGKYHLYKMNNQGNWDKIHEITKNDETITLPLLQTKLATDELIIKNDDNEKIYHHFKVISENSSGMYSSEEKILTL